MEPDLLLATPTAVAAAPGKGTLYAALCADAGEAQTCHRHADAKDDSWGDGGTCRVPLPEDGRSEVPLRVQLFAERWMAAAELLGEGEYVVSRECLLVQGAASTWVKLSGGARLRLKLALVPGGQTSRSLAATCIQLGVRCRWARARTAEARARVAEHNDRVEGLIEGLNSAIDRVNQLEDEKAAVASAAHRAAAVVRTELDDLYESKKSYLQRLEPVRKAREEALAAVARAKEQEERYARALGEVEMANDALKQLGDAPGERDGEGAERDRAHSADADGGSSSGGAARPRQSAAAKSKKVLLHLPRRQDSATSQVEKHLRHSLSTAVKRAQEARRAAKKAKERSAAALGKLGRMVIALRREGGDLDECVAMIEPAAAPCRIVCVASDAVAFRYMAEVQEYERQRQGLEQVRVQTEARLGEYVA